ncbi:uncharacterized protein K452DRAFT_305611 [Aplosporella prunicola CBS 121167]|uniref:Uncharacterized protein n=1 Tax=Aplosporella prunicola CBS 121167 TaxID=1176127 RepID=A0A6A6BNG9_9PEZI|nr:uncharacterized protein K452DRAFT_305611 [Aplosporella prunicola CBS 121167]KAF2145626.1 hypothetical protein K452DRAFT_305611 [Aplosporella prunicola CBS 121167]
MSALNVSDDNNANLADTTRKGNQPLARPLTPSNLLTDSPSGSPPSAPSGSPYSTSSDSSPGDNRPKTRRTRRKGKHVKFQYGPPATVSSLDGRQQEQSTQTEQQQLQSQPNYASESQPQPQQVESQSSTQSRLSRASFDVLNTLPMQYAPFTPASSPPPSPRSEPPYTPATIYVFPIRSEDQRVLLDAEKDSVEEKDSERGGAVLRGGASNAGLDVIPEVTEEDDSELERSSSNETITPARWRVLEILPRLQARLGILSSPSETESDESNPPPPSWAITRFFRRISRHCRTDPFAFTIVFLALFNFLLLLGYSIYSIFRPYLPLNHDVDAGPRLITTDAEPLILRLRGGAGDGADVVSEARDEDLEAGRSPSRGRRHSRTRPEGEINPPARRISPLEIGVTGNERSWAWRDYSLESGGYRLVPVFRAIGRTARAAGNGIAGFSRRAWRRFWDNHPIAVIIGALMGAGLIAVLVWVVYREFKRKNNHDCLGPPITTTTTTTTMTMTSTAEPLPTATWKSACELREGNGMALACRGRNATVDVYSSTLSFA